jgi:hypothetical protein
MCGLDLYSQEKLQLRKERFGEMDSIGDVDGKKIRRRLGEEEDGLTRGATMSATKTEKEGAASRELGQRPDSAQGGERRAR